MARADFVTSLVLLVFGLGVVGESWRMPRFTEFGTSIWSAPGVVPGMIGIALTIMAVALFLRSRSERHAAEITGPAKPVAAAAVGDAPPSATASAAPEASAGSVAAAGSAGSAALRVGLAFALCLGFAGVMVGRVPFLPAAFVFVLAFILIFDFADTPGGFADPKRLAKRAALALVVAAAASFAIATIFEDIFLVRLP